jgi:hypothetical protein
MESPLDQLDEESKRALTEVNEKQLKTITVSREK